LLFPINTCDQWGAGIDVDQATVVDQLFEFKVYGDLARCGGGVTVPIKSSMSGHNNLQTKGAIKMRFTILASELKRALGIVGRCCPARFVLPILGNVLIDTDTEGVNGVSFTTTDLAQRITVRASAITADKYATTVEYKKLAKYVKTLADERVDVEYKAGKLQFKCGSTTLRLPTMDATEFPEAPIPGDNPFSISCESFIELTRSVVPAAATDESRPILQSVHFTIEKGVFSTQACDGYRLAQLKVPQSDTDDMDGFDVANIPAISIDTVQKTIKALKYNGPIQLRLCKNIHGLEFKLGVEVTLITQFLEGSYPNVTSIIPQNCPVQVQLDHQKLAVALRQAMVLDNLIRVTIKVMSDRVEVHGQSPQQGDFEAIIPATVKGSLLDIAFDPKILAAVLEALDEPVVIEFSGPTRPIRINTEHGVYVVMPMMPYK